MAAAVLTLGLLLALVAGTWGVLGDGSRRLLARRADDVVVSAFALDQALMKPTRIWFSGHNVYYQPALKGKGKGLVILLHKCGRAARCAGVGAGRVLGRWLTHVCRAVPAGLPGVPCPGGVPCPCSRLRQPRPFTAPPAAAYLTLQ